MQELEKILEDIRGLEKILITDPMKLMVDMGEVEDIIRKHMNDSWIPVEERMPERDKTVLACQCGGAIDAAWHDGYRWKTGFSHADWLCDVIAWPSLPDPYRKEG